MAGISSILCLAVMAGIFINANAFDYCKITCKSDTSEILLHTMCIHKSPALGPACKQPHDASLTSAEKNLIVKKHNELRQRVASGKESRGRPGPQPPAAHMPDLTWDDELATVAQRHANQCVYSHDKCRNVERFSVGQNIARSSAFGMPPHDVVTMIESWYNEVKDFNSNDISSFKGSGQYIIGHYTQIVWADTVKIGCGRIKYKNEKNWDTNYLVCNYGPGGNRRGAMIYKRK